MLQSLASPLDHLLGPLATDLDGSNRLASEARYIIAETKRRRGVVTGNAPQDEHVGQNVDDIDCFELGRRGSPGIRG